MKLRKAHLVQISSSMLFSALAAVTLTAAATQPGLYIPPLEETGESSSQPLLANCTNETGGTFQAASVNVGNQQDFGISIGVPAPEGGVTYTVISDNPAIVAAIDPSSGGIPIVVIPEGAFVSTNTFRIIGNKVGQTTLRLNTPTPGFSFTAPLNGWDVGEVKKRFVDANPATNHCRVSDSSPDLSSDPNLLASCGNDDIEAVATDGETTFMMRMR